MTVTQTGKQLLTAGLEAALYDQPRPGSRRQLAGRQEVHLVALACSTPPGGTGTLELAAVSRWPRGVRHRRARLLGDGAAGAEKNTLKPWLKEPWCIPAPRAECVARMADLLALYEAPDDPTRPRVCFEERPWQLLGDGREPLPLVPEHPARVDDAYSRHGTCHLLIMVEPCQGWRQVTVTPRRAKREFAHCMAELVEVHFPEAEKIRVVLDNLSTHTPAALYEVFPPAEARRILRKLEFHLTPVHGSWLNMAEIELAVLARQCLNRRLPEATSMAREVAAWEARRNRHRATIDWRFRTEDARMKLKSLYPKESL